MVAKNEEFEVLTLCQKKRNLLLKKLLLQYEK